MTDVRRHAESVGSLVERLAVAGSSLARLQPAVEAGAPWPLSEAIGVEAEAHWGPPEVLAHVAEMLPFWLGEIERVRAGSPEPVPFGRVAADSLRIGVIDRDRSLPPGELFDRIASDVARYQRRLPTLGELEAGRHGLHPTRGELTIAEILERFVTAHLEEHVEQLQDLLDTTR
jgi:hypothetical protein